YFFFQAEDGIRDATVTGVQTCALPISADRRGPRRGDAARVPRHDVRAGGAADEAHHGAARPVPPRCGAAARRVPCAGSGRPGARSEERRVGKGWGAGWWRVGERVVEGE